MLYLAKFKDDFNSVLVDADNPDAAVAALARAGIEGLLRELVTVPAGLFLAELVDVPTPDDDGTILALEPSGDFADWLDTEEFGPAAALVVAPALKAGAPLIVPVIAVDPRVSTLPAPPSTADALDAGDADELDELDEGAR